VPLNTLIPSLLIPLIGVGIVLVRNLFRARREAEELANLKRNELIKERLKDVSSPPPRRSAAGR